MQVEATVVQGRAAPQTLTFHAATIEDARRRMHNEGYAVLSVRPINAGWRGLLDAQAVARSKLDVDLFVEQLRDLLAAGLSLVEALSTLRLASGQTSPLLDPLAERLRGGERLSQALEAEPAFPALLVALVRSSELTSDLEQALNRFLDHRRKAAELREKVISVAIYPMLLTGVGTAVLLFLLLYVMPRFARVFEGMTGALPWSARVMVWWAQWLGNYGSVLYLALALSIVGAFALVVIPALRARVVQRLLDTNLMRHRLRTYFLARWYRGTGMLVDGGIPLADALSLSGGLLPLALQSGALAVQRAVRDGYSPSAAHARAGMLTPVAEQLLLAGERTGELGTVLTRIAHFHEVGVSRSLERAMRILEPLVMVFIGVGVGAVVVLMYLPIFELAAAIQ